MDEDKRMERSRKPIKCPSCGKAPVARILYGMPILDEELQQNLDEGRTVIGGCCMSLDDPIWECSYCGQQIFKAKHTTDD